MIERGVRPPQLLVLESFLDSEMINNFTRVLLNDMEWIRELRYAPDERQHYTLKHDWERGVDGHSASHELANLDMAAKKLIHAKLEEHYGQLLFIPRNLSYSRWMVGDLIDCHNDSGHPNGELIIEERGDQSPPTPISEHFNDFASVVYLTDDFTGGEFYFSNFDYEIKPSAGTVISFPANHFYSHGVNRLISGERLTMTLFWPGVRSVFLSLVPDLYHDWWERVANPEAIWTVMPQKRISAIKPTMIPPRTDQQ